MPVSAMSIFTYISPGFQLKPDLTTSGVYFTIIQNVEQRFTCPFSVMRNDQALRAVHWNIDLFFLALRRIPPNAAASVLKRLAFLFQRNDTCFQTRGFNHSLHEKIQFIKLGACAVRNSFCFCTGTSFSSRVLLIIFEFAIGVLTSMGNIGN